MYRKIFKNTSWLIIAQIFTKAISFFYVIFLARSLGVENFGLYSVALSYYALISSISDFGISRYLVREVAKGSKTIQEILPNVIFLRVVLTSVLFAFFSILMYILDPLKIRVSLSLLAVLAVLPQTIAISLDSVFVALQKLTFSAVSLMVLSIATAAVGFILIQNGNGYFGAVIALLLGQIFYVLSLLFFLSRYKIFLKPDFKEELFREIIRGSVPYGLLAVLGLLYFRIDIVLLSYLKGPYDTGIYAAGYKFLEAIIFLPTTFAVVVFPVFARLYNTDSSRVKGLYINSLKVMGLTGIIIFLGYIIILPNVIRFLIPAYTLSIDIVKILSISIPFMFLHVPATQLLLSTDKHLKSIVLLSVGTLLTNIILNLIFIPQFSYMAAAYVTVVSEILSFLVFFIYLQVKVFKV